MITEESNKQQQEENDETAAQRNVTWEKNHRLITKVICKLLWETESWPTKAEIARKTGLSLPTISKHLVQFEQEDFMIEVMDQFKFMSSKMLAMLCQFAMQGDMKAMRLSFEIMGVLKKGSARVKEKDS